MGAGGAALWTGRLGPQVRTWATPTLPPGARGARRGHPAHWGGAGAARCGGGSAALLSYVRGLELARRRHRATGAGPAARAWVAPPSGCSLGWARERPTTGATLTVSMGLPGAAVRPQARAARPSATPRHAGGGAPARGVLRLYSPAAGREAGRCLLGNKYSCF